MQNSTNESRKSSPKTLNLAQHNGLWKSISRMTRSFLPQRTRDACHMSLPLEIVPMTELPKVIDYLFVLVTNVFSLYFPQIEQH